MDGEQEPSYFCDSEGAIAAIADRRKELTASAESKTGATPASRTTAIVSFENR